MLALKMGSLANSVTSPSNASRLPSLGCSSQPLEADGIGGVYSLPLRALEGTLERAECVAGRGGPRRLLISFHEADAK